MRALHDCFFNKPDFCDTELMVDVSITYMTIMIVIIFTNVGNFVLKNSTNSRIWSTFDHPTDTLAPSQNLSVNGSLRSGLYSFGILGNGNLTLLWNDTIVYYHSGFKSSANVSLTAPRLSISPIGLISINDVGRTGSIEIIFSSDYAEAGDILRFLRLDNDGNLRIYSSERGSRTKNVRWSAVSDQCKVFGYCGDNGICSYNGTSPVCGCASKNFELMRGIVEKGVKGK
ncbi:hypothetical protein LIER_21482 [Lithospermum erythrorhizon]|uniref:S-locus glycoprotein domain-containing protein n=1 Tax=Lithospermum erythrorhizon TaxID=34254 RepID=A0AAV3QRF3_LITER